MNKKIMIATNLYQVDPAVYASHINMAYRVGKDLTDWQVFFSAPWRMPIDRARDLAVKNALQNECDYLFFYDDDMFLDPKVVAKLLARVEENEDIHIIQAKAYIRGYPYDPMIFKFIEKDKLTLYVDFENDVDENGLLKVDAVGCCATLIDCELFKKVPEPWFVTGFNHTEDVYFCTKARTYLENVGIYMDNDVEVGHLLDRPILTSASRKVLTEMNEKYDLNQLWIPDVGFAKRAQDHKEPLRPVDWNNPIEQFEKFKEE